MKKICVISGTRAEFGLLKNLIQKLYASSSFETSFLVTGSHLSERHGHTIDEIYKSRLKITNTINLNINDDSEISIINYISTGLSSFGKEFERIKPDLIMVSSTGYGFDGPWANFGATGPVCFGLNVDIFRVLMIFMEILIVTVSAFS